MLTVLDSLFLVLRWIGNLVTAFFTFWVFFALHFIYGTNKLGKLILQAWSFRFRELEFYVSFVANWLALEIELKISKFFLFFLFNVNIIVEKYWQIFDIYISWLLECCL